MKFNLQDRSTRNLMLFSFGKTVSLLGSCVYTFAMGLYVLKLTGSALSFATTLILGLAPVIAINPFAGVLADRIDRKLMAVASDMVNGIFMGVLWLALSGRSPDMAVIYASTFILNVVAVFYDASMGAGMPDIVKSDRLVEANSVSKVIEAVSAITGPVLGGVVYAFADINLFLAFISVSFLISGFIGLLLDFNVNSRKPAPDLPKPGINLVKDLKEAVLYMRGERRIVGIFLFLLFINMLTGFSVLVPLPYILNNILGLDPVTYGVVQGSVPVGMIAGAILVKMVHGDGSPAPLQGAVQENRPHAPFKRLQAISGILAACVVLTGIPMLLPDTFHSHTAALLFYCPVMAALGIVISFIDIPLLSMLQLQLAEDFRGRALSLGMSFVKAASPVAMLASGWFLELMPAYVSVFLGGAGLLLLAGINKMNSPL